MFNLKVHISGFIVLFSMLQSVCFAEEVKMFSNRAPSAQEMADILFKPKMKTRSISFGKPKTSAPAVSQTDVVENNRAAIGLPIKFAYNSAKIMSNSKPFLNEIGKMLSMPEYAQERLVVEGHTDASGSEGYNQYLSEKRAKAVKVYLAKKFNIAEDRLFVNGMGESQPLSGENPYAAVNRRVQFYKAP